ncbi:MAG: hypothetical protein QOJ19_4776 [Acidimicrobiia bacterium]|nr:hypothetical protein [Acidimicrobiia bacterium]
MNGDLRSLANGELDMDQFAELDLSSTDEARIDALVRGSLTVNVIDLRAEYEATDADEATEVHELLAWRSAVERVKADIAHARENSLPPPLPGVAVGASKLVGPTGASPWHWARTLGAPQFVAAAAAVLLVVMAGAAVLSRGGSQELGSPRLDGVDSTARGTSTSAVAPLPIAPAPLRGNAVPAMAPRDLPGGGFTSTTQPHIEGTAVTDQPAASNEPSFESPVGTSQIVPPTAVGEARSPAPSIVSTVTDLHAVEVPTSTTASPGTTRPSSTAPAPSTTTTAATPITTTPATAPPLTTTTLAQPPASCLAGVTADPTSATTIHTAWTATCANNSPLSVAWSINGSMVNSVSVLSELGGYNITGLPAGSLVTVTFSTQGEVRQLTVQLPLQ